MIICPVTMHDVNCPSCCHLLTLRKDLASPLWVQPLGELAHRCFSNSLSPGTPVSILCRLADSALTTIPTNLALSQFCGKKKKNQPVASRILMPLVKIGISPVVVAGDFPTTLCHKTCFSVCSQKAGSITHGDAVLHGIASVRGLWDALAQEDACHR